MFKFTKKFKFSNRLYIRKLFLNDDSITFKKNNIDITSSKSNIIIKFSYSQRTKKDFIKFNKNKQISLEEVFDYYNENKKEIKINIEELKQIIDSENKHIPIPKRSLYRMRAHCNPLSGVSIP